MNLKLTGPTIIMALLIAPTTPTELAAQQHHHYKLIDLGTFGGPNSFLAYPPPGIVVSNQGSVVGVADTPDPDPFCPDCFLEPQITYAFRWHDGVLTNLGTLPGAGNSSFAISQNASGQAVGLSENGLIDPLTGYPEIVAVLCGKKWPHQKSGYVRRKRELRAADQ